ADVFLAAPSSCAARSCRAYQAGNPALVIAPSEPCKKPRRDKLAFAIFVPRSIKWNGRFIHGEGVRNPSSRCCLIINLRRRRYAARGIQALIPQCPGQTRWPPTVLHFAGKSQAYQRLTEV